MSELLSNFLDVFTTYWLAVWVEAYQRDAHISIVYYAGIYAGIMALSTFMEGVEYLAFTRGSWNAGIKLHRALLRGILNAPLSWWKDIPVGRVINRFSKDIKSL